MANAAASDDVINFDPAVFAIVQTITLNGTQLVIENNGKLTINGTGANLLSFNGNNQSRVFSVDPSAITTINNVTITGGRVPGMIAGDRGGGIRNIGGILTINNSIVRNNRTFSGGGGIYNYNIGTLTVNNSTISNNISDSSAGGGIHNFDGSTLIVNSSTISGNFAPSGGGIYNQVTTFIANSTISGNTATNFGGGIASDGGAGTVCNISNSTISNNNAAQGGGIWRNTGTVNLRNSIIGDNTANTAPDFRSILTSEGYNLIENTSGTTITGNAAGNILGQDPRLLPLRNYGGITQTQALRATSPAIDKGNGFGINTDQRGQIRPYDFPNIPNAPDGNGSDMGAFERQVNDISGAPQFDFDSDGKSDLSVFRPSNGVWYLQHSTAGFTGIGFGASGDVPMPADYDGDGKADVAVFRPSNGTWYLQRSTQGFTGVLFGESSDKPVPADYDGDGKADIAVFRPSKGTWYLQQSTAGFNGVLFGANGDLPVPADYDGDGKSDVSVFRPSNGVWYLNRSTQGFTGVQFGANGDKPIPNAFIP